MSFSCNMNINSKYCFNLESSELFPNLASRSRVDMLDGKTDIIVEFVSSENSIILNIIAVPHDLWQTQ